VIDELDHVDRLVDGLDRVQRRTPDAILLDLMLPDSSGLETVDRMVERAPAVPIVVLTGHDETEIGVEAIQRGAEEYLVKGSITATVLVRTPGTPSNESEISANSSTETIGSHC